MKLPLTEAPSGPTLSVYKDHQAWDKYAKWFMLPSSLLGELFVCKYDLSVDENGDYAGDWKSDRAFLEANHPGCVFLY